MDVQDKSFSHKNFQRAIQGVLSIYLHLLDCPEDIDGLGHLSPAERKKERSKLKKKKVVKDDDMAVDVKDEDFKNVDPDPEGEQLLQKDFLLESGTWCSYLQNRLHLCDGKTLALVAEIMIRRGKHLQGYRAILTGLQQDANHPDIVACFVKYVMKWKAKKFTGVNQTVSALLKSDVNSVLGSDSLHPIVEYVDKFVQYATNSKSLKHVLSAIKCLQYVDKTNLHRVGEVLTSILHQTVYYVHLEDLIATVKVSYTTNFYSARYVFYSYFSPN
jgi:hypothetical protein